MRLLVSLYMWTIWLLAGVLGFPLMIACMSLFPRKQAYVYIRALCRFFLAACGIRVTARGVEQLDLSRPYILMGNHVNLLDPFTWACAIPVPFSGVEKKENFKIPFYGWLMGRWGNVPIDRKNLEQAKKDLAKAAEWMHREGIWMIVMPEGTRTRDGYVAPFKKGGFHMALDSGLQIVPMTMNGAYEVQARGKFWARPGHVEIVFGAPIDPADYGPERLEDLMRDTRRAVLSTFTGPKSEADRADVPTLVTP
jgi:1-acyl-sn-glycerol-3-phosphate acyltransferase